MPFPNFHGRQRWWTRERVFTALVRAMDEIKGPLPCVDSEWNKLKKNRLDWPTATKIYEYYGAMGRAWQAAGAPIERVSMNNLDWTAMEETFLLDNAGDMKLSDVGAALGRSYGAIRKRLQELGITARANQGYVSAAELAKEFICPYQRIRGALASGNIKGKFDKVRNRWQVDIRTLTPDALLILTKEKGTHKNTPTDVGDYYQRHGLKRTMRDGRLVVVSK